MQKVLYAYFVALYPNNCLKPALALLRGAYTVASGLTLSAAITTAYHSRIFSIRFLDCVSY